MKTESQEKQKKTFIVQSVLDQFTCDNCRPRHGKRIGLNGKTKFANIPAWHDCTSEVGCRCTMVNGVSSV